MNVRSVNAAGRAAAPARRPRGRPRVDDKRRRILDAALRVFASRGYHGTAVPEVAAAARVGTGTLYRYFATKEVLVNEVYRDAKAKLRAALLDGLDFGTPASGRAARPRGLARTWFLEAWQRLSRFARAEPAAFQFLEMQDHAPYLDAQSRAVELSVLAPLWLAGKQLRDPSRPRGEAGRSDRKRGPALRIDVMIALVWGAFVGLVKAERLGYIRLDDATLARAGEVCWQVIAPTRRR